jgi:cytochrome c-type biogenesis protein CcmE
MKQKNLKFIIGALLIVGIVIWIFGSVSSENLTYYYTPSEISTQYEAIGNDTIRLMGVVKEGSVKWVPRETRLVFHLTDDGEHAIQVEYIGAKPDMFREGQGIVVEGNLVKIDQFEAGTLLVKHNEEYKTTDHTGQKEEYYQSLQD